MTDLKPGMKGTWRLGDSEYRCTLIVAEPDRNGNLVALDDDGFYYCSYNFTPDPEPPSTVMVEMDVEDVKKALGSADSHGVKDTAFVPVFTACREALTEAGLA